MLTIHKTRGIVTGSVICTLAVVLGAFGAHALNDFLSANHKQSVFELANRYQFFHGLAILITGILQLFFRQTILDAAFWLFVVGILLFSGSLYLICFIQLGFFALATPLGGVLLIAAWICLGVFGWNLKKVDQAGKPE